MNLEDLTSAIATQFFLTKQESRRIVKFILARITADLKKGRRVYIRGFGSFTTEERARKTVRHPKTGRMITIPKRITVKFTPSRSLLARLK